MRLAATVIATLLTLAQPGRGQPTAPNTPDAASTAIARLTGTQRERLESANLGDFSGSGSESLREIFAQIEPTPSLAEVLEMVRRPETLPPLPDIPSDQTAAVDLLIERLDQLVGAAKSANADDLEQIVSEGQRLSRELLEAMSSSLHGRFIGGPEWARLGIQVWPDLETSNEFRGTFELLAQMTPEQRRLWQACAPLDTEFNERYQYARFDEAERVVLVHLVAMADWPSTGTSTRATALINAASLRSAQNRAGEAVALYGAGLEELLSRVGLGHPLVAQALAVCGHALVEQGRSEEGEALLCKAAGLLRATSRSDDPMLGWILLRLGEARLSRSDYGVALDALTEAEAMLGRLHPGGDLVLASALADIGVLHRVTGRPDRAEAYMRGALTMRSALLQRDHPDLYQTHFNLAAVLSALGRDHEAEAYFLTARDIGSRLYQPGSVELAWCDEALGLIASNSRRHAEAAALYQRAMTAHAAAGREDSGAFVLAMCGLGRAYLAAGDSTRSAEVFREAVGRARTLQDQRTHVLAYALECLGHALLASRQLAEAAVALDEAQRVLEAEGMLTGDLAGRLHLLIARTRVGTGDLPGARAAIERGLAVGEHLRTQTDGTALERAAFADVLGTENLAELMAVLECQDGRYEAALGWLERGRARTALDLMAGGVREAAAALQSAGDPERVARYEQALGREREALGRVRAAEANLSTIASGSEDAAQAASRVAEARRLLDEQTALAMAELRGLLPAGNPLPAEQLVASLASGEGLLTWSFTEAGVVCLAVFEGRVAGAVMGKDDQLRVMGHFDTLRRGVMFAPGHAEFPLPEDFARARTEAASLLTPGVVRETLRDARRVVVVPDGGLAGLPLEMLLDGDPDLGRCAFAYAHSGSLYIDRARLNDGSAEPSDRTIVLGNPAFSAGTEADAVAPPEQGLVVAYVAEGGAAHAGGVRRGDVLVSYDGAPLASREALAAARDVIDRSVSAGERPADEPVRVVLWRAGQVEETSLMIGRLGVQISEGPVDGAWRAIQVVDKVTTRGGMESYLSRASALDQVRLYGRSLAPLPGSAREVDAIARIVENPTVIVGSDATVSGLRQAVELGSPRYLHLATHGLIGHPDRPQDASVALATPSGPNSADFGFLTLGDLLRDWGGLLEGTELVVLSACDSGAGVRRGDTTLSLPLGFFHAGARGVIASLWPVDDTAAGLVMARLYENLSGRFGTARDIHGRRYAAGSPMPPLEALDEAKAWLRTLTEAQLIALVGGDGIALPTDLGTSEPASDGSGSLPARRPYDHPRYWAAFVLMGSPG